MYLFNCQPIYACLNYKTGPALFAKIIVAWIIIEQLSKKLLILNVLILLRSHNNLMTSIISKKSSTKSQFIQAHCYYEVSTERQLSNYSPKKQRKLLESRPQYNLEYYQRQATKTLQLISKFTTEKKEAQTQYSQAFQHYERLQTKIKGKEQELRALKSKKRNIQLQLQRRQASKQEITQTIQPIDSQMQGEEKVKQIILNQIYSTQKELKRHNQNSINSEDRLSELWTYLHELRSKLVKLYITKT